VRNQPDGTVEIVAAGDPGPVDALMEWARVGPPSAAVSELRVSPVADEDEMEYAGFEIRY
jgi:acylphosphatase